VRRGWDGCAFAPAAPRAGPRNPRGRAARDLGVLGGDRLAAPIAQHRPHVVLHGHAHAGTFEEAIGDVPVYNVSAPVIGRDFCVLELSSGATSAAGR
jgi:Icc-related predicted phosphoesterase